MDMIALLISFGFGLFAGFVIYRAIYNEKLRQVNVQLKGLKIVAPKMCSLKKKLSEMMPDEVDKIFGQKFEPKGGDKNE